MEGKKFLEDFVAHLSTPEDYLDPSPELRSRCLAGVKTVFDLLQVQCRKSSSTAATKANGARKKASTVPLGPLSELYVEGFDADQIWEQLQLVNEPMLAYLSKQVDKLSKKGFDKLPKQNANEVVSESGSDGVGESESDFDEGADVEGEYSDEEGDELDADHEETSKIRGRRRGKNEGRKTVVDDKFFKLVEMEQFLDKMEREQQQQKQGSHCST